MTCIIGYVCDGTVWMGCDSFVGNHYIQSSIRNPKVMKRKTEDGTIILFGFAGDVRGGLLMENLSLPKYEKEPRRYVGISLIENIRNEFKDYGYLERNNEMEIQNRMSVMVGIDGRLFTIQHDFNVIECLEAYQTLGSANEVALGAICVLDKLDLSPREKISRALTAAEMHTPYVHPPFVIIDSKT
jgi:ATP-dependent protease HslVU (ClpYQ) peptidase subunit